jgi:hypothetical protein
VVIEDVIRAAISPDGATIAFLRDEQPSDVVGASTLWFWTARGGERKYQEFSGRGFVEAALAFSADGRMLALSAVQDDRSAARGARLAAVGSAAVRWTTVPTAAVEAGCRPARHKPRVDARFAAYGSGSDLAGDIRVTSLDGGSSARPGVVVEPWDR